MQLHRQDGSVGRGVAKGRLGAEPPWNLADQLTLYKPRRADYAPYTTARPSGFKKLSTPLSWRRNSLLRLWLLVPKRLDIFYAEMRQLIMLDSQTR